MSKRSICITRNVLNTCFENTLSVENTFKIVPFTMTENRGLTPPRHYGITGEASRGQLELYKQQYVWTEFQ